MEVSLVSVAQKIREYREGVMDGKIQPRQSLVSIDDEEVATYQIEITTDNGVRNHSLPPRFTKSDTEEYLAEFDLVPTDEQSQHMAEDICAAVVTPTESFQDQKAPKETQKTSVFAMLSLLRTTRDSPGSKSPMSMLSWKSKDTGSVAKSAISTPSRKTKEAEGASVAKSAMSTPSRTMNDTEDASVAKSAMSTPSRKTKNVEEASVASSTMSTASRTAKDAEEALVPKSPASTSVRKKRDKKEVDAVESPSNRIKSGKPPMAPIKTEAKASTVSEKAVEKYIITPPSTSHEKKRSNDANEFTPPPPSVETEADKDDDTKSLTASSSESFSSSPQPKIRPEHIALDWILDRFQLSCQCINRCDPRLEQESVARAMDEVIQEQRQKLVERGSISSKNSSSKGKESKPKKRKKSHSTKEKRESKLIPRFFASKQEKPTRGRPPLIPEWGTKASQDESETSTSEEAPTTVGMFFQNRFARSFDQQSTKGKDDDSKRSKKEAKVTKDNPVAGAVLSVKAVKLRQNSNEDDSLLEDDYDEFSLDDSDSEYTTELVQVEYDPSKLADTMDADKYLAREVLRRYAEMTGVSLEELIEDVVDESLASIALDA